MEELLKLVQLVSQEIPQARVKVDSLMITHYFTVEELLNICNKYAEYKCTLANVVEQSEQLPCQHCGNHNLTWYGNDDNKTYFCFECKKEVS